MSEEMKLCPFCRETPEINNNNAVWCATRGCPGNKFSAQKDDWNTRPIEDALKSELEQTRGELAQTEMLLHADCDCDSCPLQDEPACDELCASKGTLITRIAEDRANLARKDAEIKALEELVEALDNHRENESIFCEENSKWGCPSNFIEKELDASKHELEYARARLAEVRGEK